MHSAQCHPEVLLSSIHGLVYVGLMITESVMAESAVTKSWDLSEPLHPFEINKISPITIIVLSTMGNQLTIDLGVSDSLRLDDIMNI
jgi:hypothetical protein